MNICTWKTLTSIFIITIALGVYGCSKHEVKKHEVGVNKITINKFSRDNCGPCRTMESTFWNQKEVKDVINGFAKFNQYNTSTADGYRRAKELGVNGVPCVILTRVENGREIIVDSKIGYTSRMYSEYLKWLKTFQN